ncbi:hypothetical protein B296_00007491 [Ensete ventricosum]|uniref:Uncharacterized protein n=1 Tax=Ensete ventricosum TaxID=4639 RepID=A0A426XSD2_ENSVE|nr:hypothetical protein B296_00007491 [Ensete ventricosum]
MHLLDCDSSLIQSPLHPSSLQDCNSPHLCELYTTLMVIEQHILLYTVSSFTKRSASPGALLRLVANVEP